MSEFSTISIPSFLSLYTVYSPIAAHTLLSLVRFQYVSTGQWLLQKLMMLPSFHSRALVSIHDLPYFRQTWTEASGIFVQRQLQRDLALIRAVTNVLIAEIRRQRDGNEHVSNVNVQAKRVAIRKCLFTHKRMEEAD